MVPSNWSALHQVALPHVMADDFGYKAGSILACLEIILSCLTEQCASLGCVCVRHRMKQHGDVVLQGAFELISSQCPKAVAGMLDGMARRLSAASAARANPNQ